MRGRWQFTARNVSRCAPEVEKRMLDAAMPPSPTPTTRQESDQFVRAEVARRGRVIKEAGVPQQ